MADKANLKIADQPVLSDDDPFAELTRIMGFDPRQPVKQAGAGVAGTEVEAAEAVPARPALVKAKSPERAVAKPIEALVAKPAEPAVGEVFGDVDLGIDLERELMGELADDLPSAPKPVIVAASVVPSAISAPASELRRSVEAEAAAAEPMSAAPEPAAEPMQVDRVDERPLVEAEMIAMSPVDDGPERPVFDDFDEAVVAEMQSSFQHVGEAGETRREDAAEPAALGEVHDQAELDVYDEIAAEAVEPAALADMADGKAEIADARPSLAAQEAPETPPFSMEDASTSEWELDEVFDRAIAGERNVAPPAADTSADRGDASVLPPALAVFRRMQSVERKPEAAPIVAAPTQEAVEIALDASLEDELNALLGNTLPASVSARQDMAPEPVVARNAEAYEAPRPDIDEEWEPVESAAPMTPLARPPAPVVEAASIVAGHWADGRPVDRTNQPRHNQQSTVAAPVAEAQADDLDGLFDDQDFDAAISNAVAQTDWEAEPVRPVGAVASKPEESMPRDGHDPYAALAALSASLTAQPAQKQQRFADDQPATYRTAGAAYTATAQDVPEIETVDVPEQAVALADDLDLPELAYDNEPAPHYDDLDAEFTSLLDDMNASAHDTPPRAASLDQREIRYDDAYFDRLAPAAAAGAASAATPTRPAYADGFEPTYADAGRPTGHGATQDTALADMEFAYDPDFDEEMAEPAYAPIAARSKPRRGLLIASVVGGVALLGGVAAFALSFGDGNGATELALVKADPSPVKVKPENPGGTVIPNQDSKVYDSVAGAQPSAEPAQEKLLSSAEEPIEMPMPDDEPIEPSMSSADEGSNAETAEPSMPAGKATDRIEQITAEPGVDESVEVAAVAPRKVRTMVVKADGTLVAREEPAPVEANPVESASEGIVDPVASAPIEGDAETTSTVPTAAEAKPTAAARPATAAAQPPAEATPAPAEAAAAQPRASNGATPTRAPIAPARPSDQPVDIVGEVKPERVAALAPAAAAAAPGSWSMQIASQPTEAAAQSSYQDLLRRYGSVLGGHQATIVKAEIAGKGTFWRVRVPAGGRNDAIKLCENYKAAGGSCFVSK